MKLYESINKNRRDYFKTATTKEKFKYLADYYGFRTIVFLVVLALVIWAIVSSCNRPTSILNGTFVNLPTQENNVGSEVLAEEFIKTQELNSKEYTAAFSEHLNYLPQSDPNSTYESQLAISAYMAAGELDFLVAPTEMLMDLAYSYALVDLTTILSKEQIELYEPYFLYIDMALVDEVNDPSKMQSDIANITYPDCRKPEEMEKPVPVCIDFSHVKQIQSLYHSKKLDLSFSIVATGKNKENAVKFLDFINK